MGRTPPFASDASGSPSATGRSDQAGGEERTCPSQVLLVGDLEGQRIALDDLHRRTDLFDERTVASFADRFRRILGTVTADGLTCRFNPWPYPIA